MSPGWRVWEGYRGRLFRRDHVNGVPVLRTYVYVPRDPRHVLKRVLYDTSFGLSALLGGAVLGGCDLVVAVSPPLQAGLAGWLLSRLRNAPLFVHLQDLVPDAALATGLMGENGRALRAARWLEGFIYRQAAAIGVISEGFRENLRGKGVPPSKVHLLPNSIDLDFMRSCPPDAGIRAELGAGPGDFLVMYSGSIALKQGLEVLIEAAGHLQKEAAIKFAIVGDGPPLAELKARAERLGLRNLTFAPLQDRERLPEHLSAADALVVTQRRAITDAAFPGKLLYYMAAGRPIVASVSAESETGRFVAAHAVGVVAPPEDPAALVEAVRQLRTQGGGRLGRNGRQVVEACFDRREVLARFAERLQAVAEQGGRASGPATTG
jgi:colanic acid biosynthesis glycosyl transferase WcaI